MPQARSTAPIVLLYLLVGCMSCLCLRAAGSAAGASLVLAVKSPSTSYRLGEPVPLSITVANQGAKKQFLVRVQEGSTAGLRYPLVQLTVRPEDGGAAPSRLQPADKTVPPLSPEAFFMLLPGAERDLAPTGLDLTRIFQFERPGRYRLEVRYSTLSEKEWEWYGPYDEAYWEARYEDAYWRGLANQEQRNRACMKSLSRIELNSEAWVFEILPNS